MFILRDEENKRETSKTVFFVEDTKQVHGGSQSKLILMTKLLPISPHVQAIYAMWLVVMTWVGSAIYHDLAMTLGIGECIKYGKWYSYITLAYTKITAKESFVNYRIFQLPFDESGFNICVKLYISKYLKILVTLLINMMKEL